MATLFKPEWERRDFVFRDWQPEESWCSLDTPDRHSARQIQQLFWEQAQGRIRAELDEWTRDGWELLEFAGPAAIKLRKSEQLDFEVDPSDVVLWLMTCGLGLLVHL